MQNIVWLGEPACHDPFAVGGKAASLSRLAEHHPVPPGFALTTALFERASHAGPTPDGVPIPTLPAPLTDEVATAYRLLATRCGEDQPAVAVRSSAVDEDGQDASFAGQHETFLNVVGPDAVLDAIGRCWASFTAPHAIEYRRKQGLPISGVRVAVLVQYLVVADSAAVVFTADPLTGDRSTLVINASWGLGESIVGGTTTPDVYQVRKDDLSITQRQIADKQRMTVAVPAGTREVMVPGFLRALPALTDDQIVEMARLGLALERTESRPVDIECAYRADRLYLLQCRPITTLGHAIGHAQPPAHADVLAGVPEPDRVQAAPDEVAASPLAGERIEPPANFPVAWETPDDARLLWTLDRVHWPDPVLPLVFAVAGDALARGLRAAAAAYELPVADVRVSRINTYRYQANVPLHSSHSAAVARHERSQAKLRAAMAQLRASWTTAWLPEVQAHLAYWEGFDLAGAPTSTLLAHLDETLARADRLWEIHFLLASPMHGAIGQFGKLHRELFGGTPLDGYRLLRGASNKILLAGKSLWYLSRLALALPEVRAVLQGDAATPTTLGVLGRTAQGQEFLVDLLSYLEEYGQRGDGLNLERPSWAEDPTPVLEDLRGLMAQADRDVAGEMAATWEEIEGQIAEARAALVGYPQQVRTEFEFLLAAAQEAVVLSEDHNYWIDARGMHQVRRVFVELGRRLVAAGAIGAPGDVFYLTAAELRETATVLPDLRRQALVAERRAEIERFRAIAPPPALGTRPAGDGLADQPAPPTAEPHLLRGHAGSAGIARGTVRVLRSLGEAGKLKPGDVLVAETLSSSWTPLFATAVAVVTDTGGILSHAAVVAREYAIPAVLGADGATSQLRDGQLVEVDGSRGTVRVVAQDEGAAE